MKKRNNKGFTLVELLVVIAIIGILAVVAVPALFKNIEKGKVADLEADISAIRSAALSVYADTSQLPSTEDIDLNKDTNKLHLISQELESLSNPFSAEYKIEVKNNKSILNIKVNKSISESGMKKLGNDLGDKVKSNTDSALASGGIIEIELMSK